MIARGFRPVVWVFMISVAVLGCYMLNLRVASERAELARLDRRIVTTQQSIRELQTEVGTRSRIPQLEEWNDQVLALSAPVTAQYVQHDVSLARFDVRQPQLADQAEVRLASAETADAPAGVSRPEATSSATPAPQRAIAAPAAAARPEMRRASLLTAPVPAVTPKGRDEAPRIIRTVARDDEAVAPGPRDARRPAQDRAAPARLATLAPGPGRGGSGRVLATEGPARELRKAPQPDRRRSNRD